MTASMPTLTLYSRCPHVVDESSGRRCDHPGIHPLADRPVLHAEIEEMRHSISFACDRGHAWSLSWSTVNVLT